MSTLEIARQAYEDIEIYEKSIAEHLDKKPKTSKQQVWQQHHINNLVEKIQEQSQAIVASTLRDEDGSFKEELEAMKGENAFGSFYSALKETKDFHLRYPNVPVRTAPDVESESACTADFSGEEMWGKYLDLHGFHERAVNMKHFHHAALKKEDGSGSGAEMTDQGEKEDGGKGEGQQQLEYMEFLDAFHRLEKIPRPLKRQQKYAALVAELSEYLVSFLKRTQPLVNVEAMVAKECDQPFEEAWAKGVFPGWEGQGGSNGSEGSSSVSSDGANGKRATVDLSQFHSPEAVAALGMARLKEGLEALGLKAGGSLSDRSARLFSVKGLAKEDFPKKLLAAGSAGSAGGGAGVCNKGKRKNGSAATTAAEESTNNGASGGAGASAGGGGGGSSSKQTALMEARIAFLSQGELAEVVANTKRHVEKKHTMLFEERNAELLEEEAKGDEFSHQDESEGNEKGGTGGGGGSDDEEVDDEAPLYNPLNLPLGWDGKPIPYWLFKLHGLGVEYKCEICGNASYFGRKAFDRHFQEWRHAYGMRCLGIPNTKHFHDICLIEDAAALYAKLKTTLKQEQFDASAAEEYEDSDGHVLNRKTYEDLARQGLL